MLLLVYGCAVAVLLVVAWLVMLVAMVMVVLSVWCSDWCVCGRSGGVFSVRLVLVLVRWCVRELASWHGGAWLCWCVAVLLQCIDVVLPLRGAVVLACWCGVAVLVLWLAPFIVAGDVLIVGVVSFCVVDVCVVSVALSIGGSVYDVVLAVV